MEKCKHEITMTEQTFSNGTKHLRKDCHLCGRCLGYYAYQKADEAVLHFGKYFDKTYLQVAKGDPGYLRWLLLKTTKPRIKELIENAFKQLT